MDIQTISSIAIIGVVFSIVISIFFPIMLVIIGNKKYKASLSSFFIGAGVFVLFAMILEQFLHILVIFVLGLNANDNPWLYRIYGAAAAAIFEETGRIVAMKVFMKNKLDFPNAFMYGIGHGGVEAIIIGGIANIGNLITMLMINSGVLQQSLAVLSAEEKAESIKQMSALWTTSPDMFFASGIERVCAVILQISLSLIIYKGLKAHKKEIVAIAFGIHFVVDFIAVVCSTRINVWLIELIVAVMSIATFVLAHKLNKDSKY